MIDKGYIDTCLLAAYYCPESLSRNAEKLLLTVEQPIISLLTEVELLSVLSKKFRKKELSKRHLQQIATKYMEHIKEGYFHKITVKSEHYTHARDLLGSFNYSLHSLDALHLAIAISEEISLITADLNLAKVAKKIKAKHIYCGITGT